MPHLDRWFASRLHTALLLAAALIGATSAKAQLRIDNPDPPAWDPSGEQFSRSFGFIIDLSGDTLAIGYPRYGETEFEPGDGRVYLFRWLAPQWVQAITITPPTPMHGFGCQLALEDDLLAIRCGSEEDSVSLFRRSHGGVNNWGLLNTIQLPLGEAGNFVASRRTIAVATTDVSSNCAIVFFEEDQGGPGNWGLASVVPRSCAPGSFPFISNEVDFALAGETIAHREFRPADFGHDVVVRHRDAGGLGNWGEVQRIIGPIGFNEFGRRVLLDGDTLVVVSQRSVFFYTRDVASGGAFVERRRLVNLFQFAQDREFALSGDNFFIGDPQGGVQVDPKDAGGEGEVIRRSRNEGGVDQWGVTETILHPEPGTTVGISPPQNSSFGIKLAAEGNTLLVADVGYGRNVGPGIVRAGAVFSYGQPSRLEVADPLPNLLNGGTFRTDPNTLASGGTPVRGAAADGVTRLLLRFVAPGPGTVQFTVVGPVAEDGGVDEIPGGDRLQTVTVPVVATNRGHRAFATYRVPDEFSRNDFDSVLPLAVRAP